MSKIFRKHFQLYVAIINHSQKSSILDSLIYELFSSLTNNICYNSVIISIEISFTLCEKH